MAWLQLSTPALPARHGALWAVWAALREPLRGGLFGGVFGGLFGAGRGAPAASGAEAPAPHGTRQGQATPLLEATIDALPPSSPLARPLPAAPQYSVDTGAFSALYFVSRRPATELPCLDWLAAQGQVFRSLPSLGPASALWAAPAEALVLVDLDLLGGIALCAPALMALRLKRPDLCVIVLSEEVASHDFGLERLALADVTLRLPCAPASFEFALGEAPINNAAWNERLASLTGEA